MSQMTDYLEQQLNNWVFKDTFMPSPSSSVYVALHSGDPSDSGENNEIGAADYDRVEVVAANWTVDASPGGTVTNDVSIVFPEATTNWGTVSHVSIWDGPSGTDNAFYYTPLSASQTINEGEKFEIRDGDFILELDP